MNDLSLRSLLIALLVAFDDRRNDDQKFRRFFVFFDVTAVFINYI